MIAECISALNGGSDLSYKQAKSAALEMLRGGLTDVEAHEFLSGLAAKGETDDELAGMLDAMRDNAVRMTIRNANKVIDVCGTGGDGLGTFNISTATAFVVAASGTAVAKHGNRSSSGGLGSADVFECLGCELDASPQRLSEMLEKFNICFMFAQRFHPAMKNIAHVRKKIGTRTAFNMLGPLCNPAYVTGQLVGVFSDNLLERIPSLLKRGGAKSVMAVRSADGLDELSTSSKNKICTMRDGRTVSDVIDPEKLGLRHSSLRDIQVGTKQQAMRAFVSVLEGTANTAMTQTIMLNAAAALIVGGGAADFSSGIEIADDAIKSGRTARLLHDFTKSAGDIVKLEEILGA